MSHITHRRWTVRKRRFEDSRRMDEEKEGGAKRELAWQTGRTWQEVKREEESWFSRNVGGGGGDMGREELRRRGGQRGEQQVVCTSVTLCSSRPRMPRMNRGGGRRAGGQGGGGKWGHYATSKRSITKQAYIYFEAEFKKFLSTLYIAQKR